MGNMDGSSRLQRLAALSGLLAGSVGSFEPGQEFGVIGPSVEEAGFELSTNVPYPGVEAMGFGVVLDELDVIEDVVGSSFPIVVLECDDMVLQDVELEVGHP